MSTATAEFTNAPVTTQAGDPDPMKPFVGKPGDPGLEQKLAELRQKITRDKSDAVKATAADPGKPAVAKVEVPDVGKPALEIAIGDETSDADIEKHVLQNANGMSPQQLKRFKELTYETRAQKRDLKARDAALAERETKLKELESRPPVKDEESLSVLQKEREALQKKLEEKEIALAGTDVKQTERYKSEIAIPMADMEGKFRKFAEDYEVSPEDLIELSSLRGKKRDAKFEELTLDMSAFAAGELRDMIKGHAELLEKQHEIVSNGKKTYDTWLAQEREQRTLYKAQIAGERIAAVPKVWDEAVLAAVPAFKDAKDGELAASLKSTRDFISQADDDWFSKQPVADRARLTAQAAAFPVLVKHHESERTALTGKIAELEAHITALKGSKPNLGGRVVNGSGVIADTDAQDDPKRTLEDEFKSFRQRQGIR